MKKDIKDKNLLRVIEKATNKNDEYKYENINRLIIDLKSYLLSGEIKLDDDMQWYCPNCGNKDKNEMQVMRRTCGYIGSNMWGKGRTQEISQRVLHL